MNLPRILLVCCLLAFFANPARGQQTTVAKYGCQAEELAKAFEDPEDLLVDLLEAICEEYQDYVEDSDERNDFSQCHRRSYNVAKLILKEGRGLKQEDAYSQVRIVRFLKERVMSHYIVAFDYQGRSYAVDVTRDQFSINYDEETQQRQGDRVGVYVGGYDAYVKELSDKLQYKFLESEPVKDR